ncbi:MAG TPA: glycosyltransferase family 39 protein [Anaerolineales bacterium]|nr:glycosyltransferase family 39 protein [Anaerolineales bacterium]
MTSTPSNTGSLAYQLNTFLTGRRVLVVIIILWLIFNLPSLLTYPGITSDEAQFSAVGWNFFQHGSFRSPIIGPLGNEEHTGIYYGRLYALLLGLDLKIFGIGIVQARLSSMLGGLVAGILLWCVAGELKLSQTARLGSILLFLFSWKVFLASHRARPDIWMAVCALTMFFLYLRARQAPTIKSYLILGVVTAYLIDVHFPVSIASGAISLMVLGDFLQRRLSWKVLATFGTGAMVGIAAWLALWLLPDPAAAFLSWRHSGSLDPAATTASGMLLPNLASQFLQWLSLVYVQETRLGPFEGLIIAAAIVALILKRAPSDRVLLAWLGSLLFVLFIAPFKQTYHVTMIVPLTSLIIARGGEVVGSYIGKLSGGRWAVGAVKVLALCPLLLAYVAADVSLAWRSRELSYQAYATALRALIPPGKNVMGEAVWWFEFHDGIFTSDLYPSNWYGRRQRAPGPDVWMAEALANRQVEVVLLDGRFGSHWQEYLSPEQKLLYDAYKKKVESACNYVGDVELPYYGLEQDGPGLKQTTVWQCPSWQN